MLISAVTYTGTVPGAGWGLGVGFERRPRRVAVQTVLRPRLGAEHGQRVLRRGTEEKNQLL